MTNKRLIWIAAAALLVIAAAVYLRTAEDARYDAEGGELLFPGLAEQTDDIARIELRGGQDSGDQNKQITLIKGEEGWGVAERNGYSANTRNIRRLLVRLTELKLTEPKTKNPDRYARLGVGDPEQDAGARLVRLQANDGSEIAALILGKSARGSGTYLRLPGEAQSWRGSESLTFGISIQEWLDRKLLDINQNRIARLDIQPVEGRAYSVVREDENNLALEPAAGDGMRVKPGMLNRLISVMQNLSAEDLHMDTPPEGNWATAVHILDDGTLITLQSLPRKGNGGAALLKISVAAAEDATDEVRAEAAKMQKQFAGHVYEIVNHQAIMMGQHYDKVIEPVAANGEAGG